MAIRIDPTTTSLNTREYLATKRTVASIKAAVIIGGDCCFCVPNCDWVIPALANLTNINDDYTNDRKDFIITVAENSTVTGTLIKIAADGTETDTVITDDTFGNFFPLGVLKDNTWGFYMEWHLVASGLGFGEYKFNITVLNSSSNEIFNETSVCFQLMPYNCDNAHRTVRIETEQSGFFEGGFDYTGIFYQISTGPFSFQARGTWSQQIRLFGRFYREGYDYEVDNLVLQGRGQEQIQARTIKRYNLKLDTIETKLSNQLINDMLLAPDVRISDYNISAIELYVSKRVTMTEIADPLNFTQNKNEFFDGIKFLEWKQDNIHRYK